MEQELGVENLVLPATIERVTEVLNEQNTNLPGTITVDKHGALLKTYLQYSGFTTPMIEAYNKWILETLPAQISSIPIVIPPSRIVKDDLGETIHFDRYYIDCPSVTATDGSVVPDFPALALDAARTYSSTVYADLISDKGARKEKVPLFKVPVMVGSELDNLKNKTDTEKLRLRHDPKDPGGWFPISGAEKIVLLQEKLRNSVILLYFDVKRLVPICKMTCTTIRGSKVVSIIPGKKHKTIKLNLQFLGKGKSIPVFTAYRLLGVSDPNTIMRYISQFLTQDQRVFKKVYFALQASFLKFSAIGSDIDYIAKKRGTSNLPPVIKEEGIRKGLLEDLFPQVPPDQPEVKLQMLSIMVARLAEHMAGFRDFDDRDSWSSKRIDSAAPAMEQLFMGLLNKFHNDIEKQINAGKIRNFEDVAREVAKNSITSDIVSSFASNNWGVREYYHKENITDYLNRGSIVATLSHLGRINTPASRKTKLPNPREVHGSGMGIICPAETPEGENCIEQTTPVYLANGSTERIGDLKNGDIVLTIDPITLEQTETVITQHFVKPSSELGLQMYKITSLNGRELLVTEDHPFLTQCGWIKAKDLKLDEHKICIFPHVKPLTQQVNNPQVILDKQILLEAMSEAGLKDSLKIKHVDDLEEKGYLPLLSNDDRLPTLARICGFCLADGSISVASTVPETKWAFGCEYDAKLFEDDIQKLGFGRSAVHLKVSSQVSPIDQHEYIATTYNTSHGGCFASLLIGLGLSYGRRVEKPSKPVPAWVMQGSLLVKREFLAGIQGGDGSKIQWNVDRKAKSSCRFTLLRTVMHKVKEYVSTLTNFMTQIESLFNELGIETRGVTSAPDYRDRHQVKLEFSEAQDNLIRYMDIIGYRYANDKQTESAHIVEYIRYRKIQLENRINLKKEVIGLYKSGFKPMVISQMLNITHNEARAITQQYNKEGLICLEKTTLSKDVISMEDWNDITIAKNNCIFMPIASIDESEPAMISDFTTFKDTHSFVANSFVTHNCGLVKNLAITAYISVGRNENLIKEAIRPFISAQPTLEGSSKCILNGIFLGWCAGSTLRDFCVQQRRTGRFYKDTCVILDKENFLYIYCDGSRPMRPLLIVDTDGKLVIQKKNLWNASFDELLREGCAEYIDTWEQEYIMLAQSIWAMEAREKNIQQAVRYLEEAQQALQTFQRQIHNREVEIEGEGDIEVIPEDEGWIGGYRTTTEVIIHTEIGIETKLQSIAEAEQAVQQASAVLLDYQRKRPFTHCELDPQAIMGISAAVMPMPEKSQAPRVTYQASMIKQALGMYHSNYRQRFDTTAKVLAFPTRPLFEPQMNGLIGLNEMPSGTTIIIAIMAYKGFNQEDAIIFKKEAIERGLFLITKYMAHKSVQRQAREFVEKFERPPLRKGEPSDRYIHLDENGIARVGSLLRRGDCIIGKTRRDTKTGEVSNVSIFAGLDDEGIVDHVVVSLNAENIPVAKVSVRQVRPPIEGDKFASRYAQKGTIGLILPAIDMPFSETTGIVPDIIINPHCIPSRMTIGKLLEIVTSKYAAFKGERVDASAFRPFDLETFKQTLRDYNYNPSGTERFRSGITGQVMDGEIFTGPCYYQALRHHVKDKIQQRGKGAKNLISGQPVGGRSREGGQKIGTMETDSFISHGASSVIQERLCYSSDAYKTVWCQTCGTIAVNNIVSKEFICRNCEDKANFGVCTIPYAFRLLTHMLSGVGFNIAAGFKNIGDAPIPKVEQAEQIEREETRTIPVPEGGGEDTGAGVGV